MNQQHRLIPLQSDLANCLINYRASWFVQTQFIPIDTEGSLL